MAFEQPGTRGSSHLDLKLKVIMFILPFPIRKSVREGLKFKMVYMLSVREQQRSKRVGRLKHGAKQSLCKQKPTHPTFVLSEKRRPFALN